MARFIKSIQGIAIGHASDFDAATGVTVILCPNGMTPGVDIRGSATSTRQIDSLFPHHIVPKIHALCLAGGSAYGLEAGTGVMRYLEERGFGFGAKNARVPIVPTAAIFDLAIGKPNRRPDGVMGYQACVNAAEGGIKEGSVGAGTGATVGKFYGIEQAMKGGLGTASRRLRNGLLVNALAVVNAYGDVRNPKTGRILAGARRSKNGKAFADTARLYKKGIKRPVSAFQNTTLGVITTNARLEKSTATLVARLGQGGLAKTISPAYTIYDGDIVFALGSGEIGVDPHTVGLLGEEALMEAIIRAVTSAKSLGGVPSYSEKL
ncbi:MAG: P1 family peptidase [Pseudomonadota bacterium]